MPNAEHTQTWHNTLNALGIKTTDTVAGQVMQFLMYCHHGRLRAVTTQFRQERKKALGRQKRGLPLTQRQTDLLHPQAIWSMVVASYNQVLRDYGFLYIAFNLLEDSLRRSIDVHYCGQHGDNWYQDDAHYPTWVRDELDERGKLARAKSRYTGHAFTEFLSFGELVAFLYTRDAWTQHNTQSLFVNRSDLEAPGTLLPNLSRCEVYERLTILQWRRNNVYHHKMIPATYDAPVGESCTPARPQYNDGTFANTRDRLYELCRYLGLKPQFVFTRIVGSYDTLKR